MPDLKGMGLDTFEKKMLNTGFFCAMLYYRGLVGEPATGNLYNRFDEGGGHKPPLLLYRLCV